MTEVDVVVVGAGLLGTAAARHLRLAGASVALVGPDAAHLADDDPFPGSSADVSRLAHLLDLPAPTIPAALRTRRAYEKLSASTGVSILTRRPHLIAVSSRSGRAGEGAHVDRASILANAETHGVGIEELDGAGASLRHHPLADAAEMRDWMCPDGDHGDVEVFRSWVEPRLSGITADGYDTAPCLVVATPSDLPQLGPVDDHTLLLGEGMHGATLADDLGRMAADPALDRDPGHDAAALRPVWA